MTTPFLAAPLSSVLTECPGLELASKISIQGFISLTHDIGDDRDAVASEVSTEQMINPPAYQGRDIELA